MLEKPIYYLTFTSLWIKSALHFTLYPMHNHLHYIRLLCWCECPALRDVMPLLQTATATTGSCMLGNEDRTGTMAHWSLLAIIGDNSRGKALGDDLASMLSDGGQALGCNDVLILLIEIEPTAKLGMG